MNDNTFDPEGVRTAAGSANNQRADLAAKILVALAPEMVQDIRAQAVPSYQHQAAFELYADTAVKMADALIERLNRKN